METIQQQLFELQDLTCRDFNAKLIPNVNKTKVIGVRIPQIRALAKNIRDEDKQLFINELPHTYQEEYCLHAAILSNSKDIRQLLDELDKFLPYVDNWAVSDTIIPKIFAKHPDEVYTSVQKWIQSPHTYVVRFGIVTLLHFFLDSRFRPEMLDTVARIHSDEYYINMAIAWYFSFALVKQYESAIPFFESPILEKWVHNKSIQKATESYRISDEKKNYLRSLKQK